MYILIIIHIRLHKPIPYTHRNQQGLSRLVGMGSWFRGVSDYVLRIPILQDIEACSAPLVGMCELVYLYLSQSDTMCTTRTCLSIYRTHVTNDDVVYSHLYVLLSCDTRTQCGGRMGMVRGSLLGANICLLACFI
ncbi:hypothetical protein EON63_18960 [archaeon]|nr:MAG: hypothetical protein EON63_18960 [archaeon]